MKERPEYQPLPHEQLLAARQADLAAYLIARSEKLIPRGTGGNYKMAEHDSVSITGNSYQWFSRGESGNSIDFLRSYYGMGFREAVEALTGKGARPAIPRPTAPERSFDFAQIELAPDMERVIVYLTETRGISRRLVDELIATKRLYQEARTNNALFPIYDGGAIVGAELNGTTPEKRFKGIKTGSKYGCGYNLTFGDKPAFALFFESAIDLLSFVDLSRMRGKDLAGCRLTSMMGLKQNIVDHALKALDGSVQPVLCVDNDEAGANFIRLMETQNSGMKTRQPAAGFKDWNDQLRASGLRQSWVTKQSSGLFVPDPP